MRRMLTHTMAASLALLLSGCEFRDLFVYGDEFRSVVLDVDWREYDDGRDPDGMTVWFYPLDRPGQDPYRSTTANVRRQELYLPGGRYQGIVVDYSPEEYSRQEFVGMDSLLTACVVSRPAAYQPDSLTIAGEGVSRGISEQVNDQLYGHAAWTTLEGPRPALDAASGLYTVADAPEMMGLDTLTSSIVGQGGYDDYIPFEERDSYQSTITVQQLHAIPHSIIWRLRVRIHISEGYDYLWKQVASISGLADGHLLGQHRNTDRSCLMTISDWEMQRTGANEGYLAATINTFGLRPGSIRSDAELHTTTAGTNSGLATDDRIVSRAPGGTAVPIDTNWWDYHTNVCLPAQIRINLSFVLRDRATVLHYHYNVGDRITAYDEQLVLRLDLEPNIALPYVDAYSGTGFGADVTPWQDEPPMDVQM